MKILHCGDLHLGKRIANLSLIEDQKFILQKILDVVDEKKVETVLIAGDVYDKSVPSEEAVALFDDFLFSLAKRRLKVMIIAGNHDSCERLSFADRLIEAADIYISPEYDGNVKKVVLNDEYGEICFYLLPFVKPLDVKRFYPDEKIESYTQAIDAAIRHMDVDPSKRNVILSHQFVTGARMDGSEDELSLGGIDHVDAWVYERFDYTALGHIHRPQNVKGNTIRYSGSPIKFSFDEEKQKKGLTIIDFKEKGTLNIEEVLLKPMRDFITIKGAYANLIKGQKIGNKEDFIHLVLTDKEELLNAFSNLSIVYANLMSLEYAHKNGFGTSDSDRADFDASLSPVELFSNFFAIKNNHEMNEDQKNYIDSLIEEIWEASHETM